MTRPAGILTFMWTWSTLVAALSAAPAPAPAGAPGTGPASRPTSPLDNLPPHVTRLTGFGERADFSHDGTRVLFLSKTFGDVFEYDLATGHVRLLTGFYPHHGYTRALYLASGDILLSGPESFDPKKPGEARAQCVLSVLDRDLDRPPVSLGVKCSEGPAVSRKRLRIAWAQVAAQYPGEMEPGSSRILEADLVFDKDDNPKLVNQRVALESKALPFKCTLEAQNFVSPDDEVLTFSAYGHGGTEVCTLELRTGKVANVSNAPHRYDEPEGIFPDGKHTLVESDAHTGGKGGWRNIDVYKLALDGSGKLTRLTHFNDHPGYKASNPVVSDDGRWVAFQLGRTTDEAGVGHGIFLLDLEKLPPAAPPQTP